MFSMFEQVSEKVYSKLPSPHNLSRIGTCRITGTYQTNGYCGTGNKNCPKFFSVRGKNRLAFSLFLE
ncbi:MAG: hypothetical protein LBU34_08970 [Planctomycetaceae bacterium]|jgi:Ni,Fe-hydrogenase III small subunit|nr:hypothetical protein [Planctomycetaceae bacterium]